MAPPMDDDEQIATQKWLEGVVQGHREERQSVFRMASRMIDHLRTNRDPGSGNRSGGVLTEFSEAPSGIPHVTWKSRFDRGKAMNIVGDVGQYFCNTFHNEKPASTFNAGFYTGVLAVKLGLINPDDFHHDSEHTDPV